LHHRSLYARFHKQHHEWKQTRPVSSEYFSVVEEILTGVIPTMAGPLLLGSRLKFVTLVAWIAFRVCESSDAHMGYDLPLILSPFKLGRPSNRHFLHHSVNTGNYGAFFTVWDRLCGTEIKDRK
jgi:sterol desaturase/sphingolipid hydroxylase (fatty acid hydroxylase superfamily)